MTIKKGLYNFYLTLPNKHDIKIWMTKKSLVSIIDVGKIFHLIFSATVVKKRISLNQSISLRLNED